jgi:hypothetical protein
VGELRILVLGDSITFGDYVDEDETYPAALERRLQAAMPARVVRLIMSLSGLIGTIADNFRRRLQPSQCDVVDHRTKLF